MAQDLGYSQMLTKERKAKALSKIEKATDELE
jgi:hypothetical protein